MVLVPAYREYSATGATYGRIYGLQDLIFVIHWIILNLAKGLKKLFHTYRIYCNQTFLFRYFTYVPLGHYKGYIEDMGHP